MIINENFNDATILTEIGSRLARIRLNKNITQKALAKESGVSLPTIQRLERGESTNLTNLTRILRTLGLLENINALIPSQPISPIMQINAHNNVRTRASTDNKTSENEGLWTWGE